jgi:hypothetical protein
MAARFRGSCLVLGVITAGASVLVGIGIPVGGLLLPRGTAPAFAMTVVTGVSLALFLLVSGVTMTLARSWVTTVPRGHVLDRRKSAMALYPLGVPAGAAILTSSFFLATLLGRIAPGTVAYLCLPAIAVVLCVVNFLVGLPLFRPSQRTIQRYAR